MFDWAYGGVNASIPRNVGPECVNFLTPQRRIFETLMASAVIGLCLKWGYNRMTFPKAPAKYANPDRTGRKFFLVLMTFILGMETGFKFTSRTVIYLLNPCHVTTAIQLYLLSAKPSPMVTVIFRMHLNFMNGPFLAYLFPETESRRIFADQAMYYLQHGLMVVIPYYLLRIGGVYNVEPRLDMSWSVFSYGINLSYHWLVLQAAALPVQVNLSHMLCPAVLDPFGTVNYRIWATCHQAVLCPLLCKLFCTISDYLITKFPLTRVKPTLEMAIDEVEASASIEKTNREKDATDGRINGQAHFD